MGEDQPSETEDEQSQAEDSEDDAGSESDPNWSPISSEGGSPSSPGIEGAGLEVSEDCNLIHHNFHAI